MRPELDLSTKHGEETNRSGDPRHKQLAPYTAYLRPIAEVVGAAEPGSFRHATSIFSVAMAASSANSERLLLRPFHKPTPNLWMLIDKFIQVAALECQPLHFFDVHLSYGGIAVCV